MDELINMANIVADFFGYSQNGDKHMNTCTCPDCRGDDPPDPRILGTCDGCGGEIYEGEGIYNISGDRIHEDCLYDWAREFKSEAV